MPGMGLKQFITLHLHYVDMTALTEFPNRYYPWCMQWLCRPKYKMAL